MATLIEIQESINDKSFDPSILTREQSLVLNDLIESGEIESPPLSQIIKERNAAAKKIAKQEEFKSDPIAAALYAEDNPYFIKGKPTAELAGDISGSLAPYFLMRKKIFGAAKSGNLWQKGPGKMLQSAIRVADKLPGRLKLVGGALKLIARVADVPAKVIASPLGRAEIYSVLGGTAGAGAGSVTYDMLNEQAGTLIASAITDDLADIPQEEIDRDITLNALDAMKTAAMWNAGAAALTPFLLGGLGKAGRYLFGAKGPKAKELAEYARDKGLPLPLNAGIADGPLSKMGQTYFKTVGVFPFVSSIGRQALEGAEQAAGRQYLENLMTFAPIMKTSALSSSIYNQAAKVFADRSQLIASKYNAFDALAETIGNPKVIKMTALQKQAKEFLQQNAELFPSINRWNTGGLGDRPVMEINKILKMDGDPLNLFMHAVDGIGDEMITPKQYKGLMVMMNRAIEGTGYQNIRASIWGLREAMETDLNSFGSLLTKDNFLKDAGIKEMYDQMSKVQGKEFAEKKIVTDLKAAEQLYGKLYDANATFSANMGFLKTGAGLVSKLRKFDSNLFTNKGINGIYGNNQMARTKLFETMERDVFSHGSKEAIQQFKVLLGAAGPKVTKNGVALFNASKARYMFNTFLDSFDQQGIRGTGKNIFGDAAMTPGVRAGTKYMQDAVEELGAREIYDARAFSIADVRLNNGIYDLKNIKFGPKEFAGFNIDKFANKLGITQATGDVGRDKIFEMLGKDGTNDFYRFVNYMKAISDIPLSDTSTYLQRRMTLGGMGSVMGGFMIGGGLFMANPLAPAIFLMLARKAGKILTDPTALRYMNDALLPEEWIKGLKGQKIGIDSKFKIRSINPKFTYGLLTQKREAFARFMNYVTEDPSDKFGTIGGQPDVPYVNPKTVDPSKIQEELQKMSYQIEQPIYDDNTIPKETMETLFAGDFLGSSGNVDTDNQMVDYVKSTLKHTRETEADDVVREEDADQAMMTENFEEELIDPVKAMQAKNFQPPQPPNTGQITPQKVAGLFPNDQLSQLIAQRQNKNNA